MDATPAIDLGRAAEVALAQMLQAARIVGRDSDGRRLVEVPVDDWVVDWFSRPRRPRTARRSRRISLSAC